MALRAAHEAQVAVSFDGGYEGAERAQVCFYPDGEEPWSTLCWLEISWSSRFCHVRHSDLLGSLMALGVSRDRFGDLVMPEENGPAWLVTLPEMAAQLVPVWQTAGRNPIKVRVTEQPPEIRPPKGDEMRDTVPSQRLDCVLASGMRLSRAKAAELIRAGQVALNHQSELRCDRVLQPGDLLSVRQFGRIRVIAFGEPTRKDRLPVTLELFTRK